MFGIVKMILSLIVDNGKSTLYWLHLMIAFQHDLVCEYVQLFNLMRFLLSLLYRIQRHGSYVKLIFN
jgi:hypothetical protein